MISFLILIRAPLLLVDFNHCCFFCACGPPSFLNAPYDTSRPDIALIPTYAMKDSNKTTDSPMNIPVAIFKKKKSISGQVHV